MGSVEEKIKAGGLVIRAQTTLLEEMKLLKEMQDQSGARKAINSELWHACAGPLVFLPQVGSLVYYFPQGHSEQHWYKDEKFSTRVKDKEGFPCFALVNKATGQAMKHSIGATHPVQLIPYNPNVLDESILWTESRDIGY